MSKSTKRGADEANAESDRLAQARRIGEACGTLAAALNRCMTEDDVRRIVREELRTAEVMTGESADERLATIQLRIGSKRPPRT